MAGNSVGKKIRMFVLLGVLVFLVLFVGWHYLPGRMNGRDGIPVTALTIPAPSSVGSATLSPEEMKMLSQASSGNVSNNPVSTRTQANKGKPFITSTQDTPATLTALMKSILANGWSKEAEEILPYLEKWQPAFKEMRKASSAKDKLDSLKINGMEPSFAVRALCVEGLLWESQGRHEDALGNYLAGLAAGYAVHGNTLISQLSALSCENIASDRIGRIAASGNVGIEGLRHAMEALNKMGSLHDLLVISSQKDFAAQRANLPLVKQQIKNSTFMGLNSGPTFWDVLAIHDKRTFKSFLETRSYKRRMTSNLDRIEPDLKALQYLSLRYMKASWWEYETEKYQKDMLALLEKSHPVVQIGMPGYIEIKTRNLVTESHLRCAKITVALMMHKIEKGQFPDTLDELKIGYFSEGVPVDPFTGKNFVYIKTKEGNEDRFVVSSAGPDSRSDQSEVVYDASNGTISAGDIMMGR